MLSLLSDSTLFCAHCQAKLQLRNFSLKMYFSGTWQHIKIAVYNLRRQKTQLLTFG